MSTSRKLAFFFIPLLAGMIHFAMNASYFETGPDALSQIDGAFNIMEGHGYVIYDGSPVKHWPPLYSIYAAIFLKIHPSFASVNIGNAILIGCISAAWSHFVFRLVSVFNSSVGYIGTLAAIASTFTIIHVLRNPSSDAVFALIAPIFLWHVLSLLLQSPQKKHATTLLVTSIILVNSHNVGAILLASSFGPVAYALLRQKKFAALTAFGATSALAALSWLGVREFFELSGSHKFEGLFGAERALNSAAFDVIHGISDLMFFSWPIGAAFAIFALASLIVVPELRKSAQFQIIPILYMITTIFYIILFVIFTSFTIKSGIGGRFSLVGYLVVITAASVGARSAPNALSLVASFALLISISSSGLRIAKWGYENNIQGLYQWNRSAVYIYEQLNDETLMRLRASRCPDDFCSFASLPE